MSLGGQIAGLGLKTGVKGADLPLSEGAASGLCSEDLSLPRVSLNP